jgi:hypothetical protein
MKTLKHTSPAWAAAIAMTTLAGPAHAVPTLAFNTGVLAADIGDTFELLLQGSGFDLTADGKVIDNLSGGQQGALSFTAGALELLSVSIDPRWTFAAANKPGLTDNTTGTLTGLSFGTFPATADDSFNIARFTFKVLTAVPASVLVSGLDFAGKVGGRAGVKFSADALPTTVNISTAVPEPQAWALMALGLGGLLLRRRRG